MAAGDDKKYVFDDRKRPALPYVPHACFEIKRHEPLTPFDNGKRYKYPEVSRLSDPLVPSEILRPSEILEPNDNLTPWSWWASEDTNPSKIPPETITERYLRHRPRKTTPHHEDRTTRRLEIIRQIRVRDGAYAQVVQCRVDGIQGPLVAKIFDPLYRWDDVELDEPQSPVGLTESEWSREAAAYARIQRGSLDGIYTPRFEGCWSFDMPWELELVSNSAAGHVSTASSTTSGHQSGRSGGKRGPGSPEELELRKLTRNVRLLLMEYAPGDSIQHLLETGAYQKLSPEVRMDLLAQIAQADSYLRHIFVNHGDWHSRNAIVVYVKKEWRVVIVDFAKSVVLDLPNAMSNIKGRLRPAGKLPPNPMTRCRGSWPIDGLRLGEANWIDKRYDSFKARREWMEARWGEGSASAHLYQPIEYAKLHRPPPTEE